MANYKLEIYRQFVIGHSHVDKAELTKEIFAFAESIDLYPDKHYICDHLVPKDFTNVEVKHCVNELTGFFGTGIMKRHPDGSVWMYVFGQAPHDYEKIVSETRKILRKSPIDVFYSGKREELAEATVKLSEIPMLKISESFIREIEQHIEGVCFIRSATDKYYGDSVVSVSENLFTYKGTHFIVQVVGPSSGFMHRCIAYGQQHRDQATVRVHGLTDTKSKAENFLQNIIDYAEHLNQVL